jgi:hypothetical protein
MTGYQRYKIYKRYKELWLMIAGFAFTSIIGTAITGYHQSLIDDRNGRETRMADAKKAGMETLHRISEDISKRHYHSLKMIDRIRSANEAPPAAGIAANSLESVRAKYSESMERWNLDWNLMRVLIKRTFSEELETLFYDFEGDKRKESADDFKSMSITGKFRTLHQALRGAEKATDSERRNALLDKAQEMYNALGFDLYNLFDTMAFDIQTGDLGENRASE